MKTTTYFWLLAILLFSSCYSRQQLSPDEASIPLTTQNLDTLNGFYQVDAWTYFAPRAIHKAENHPNGCIKLEVKNDKTILAYMYDNNKCISKKKVKGKIEDGLFRIRYKVRPRGIPLVFFSYYDSKIDLVLQEGPVLYMNIAETRAAMLLMMAGGGTIYTDEKFKQYR